MKKNRKNSTNATSTYSANKGNARTATIGNIKNNQYHIIRPQPPIQRPYPFKPSPIYHNLSRKVKWQLSMYS